MLSCGFVRVSACVHIVLTLMIGWEQEHLSLYSPIPLIPDFSSKTRGGGPKGKTGWSDPGSPRKKQPLTEVVVVVVFDMCCCTD